MSRFDRATAFAAMTLLLLATTQFILILHGLDGWETRVPQWDPSAHALDSIHFARAFRNFSPMEFLVQLHNSAMWPPVIPLLQAPFHLVFGESILTARYWTSWTVLPAMAMVFLVGLKAHRRFGIVVGALASTLLLISPIFQEHALQEMFEIPGICLCMVTLYFYLRYLESGDIKEWRRTCLAGIILFFAKFNYAVLIMLPIVVSEFSSRTEFRQLVMTAARRFFQDVNWRSAFSIFVLLYAVFLIYVQKVGIRFDVLGQTVVITKSFGNPLYILFAIILIRNWLVNRELLKSYIRNIWSAPEPIRSLLRFDILPALIWLCYPVFFMHFFLYMFNEKTRHQSFWSMETLTFYPGAVINAYAPNPILGGLTLASLFVLLLAWKKIPKISRFFAGMALFNLALTITHPNYQPRYLMTTIPLLYLVTGLVLAHAFEWSIGARKDLILKLSAPVLMVALILTWPPKRERLQEGFIRTSQSETSRELFESICQESKDTLKNTVVGFSNYVSPSSIALTCYEMFSDIKRESLPTAMGRLGFPNEKSGAKIVEANAIDRFFVIDYSNWGISPGRLQERFLLDEVKERLKTSTYIEELLVDQGKGGLRVTVYRKDNLPLDSH